MDMDSDADRARMDALSFLRRYKTGVLATLSPEGTVRSRLLYYVCDGNLNIFFCTLSDTRKYADLSAHTQASFTVSTEDVPQTIQIEGVVSELTDGQKMMEGISSIIDTLMSNDTFYWPVLKLQPGKVVIMQLKPTWIRWADYAFAEGGNIFTEILVK